MVESHCNSVCSNSQSQRNLWIDHIVVSFSVLRTCAQLGPLGSEYELGGGEQRVIPISAAWGHPSGRNAVRKRMATAVKRQRMRKMRMTLRRLKRTKKKKRR